MEDAQNFVTAVKALAQSPLLQFLAFIPVLVLVLGLGIVAWSSIKVVMNR